MDQTKRESQCPQFSRRGFLERSAGQAGLAVLATTGVASAQTDAQRPLRIAVMGVNSRGRQLTSRFARFPQVEVRYICEPDLDVVGPAVKAVTDLGRRQPQVVQDFRIALADAELDALFEPFFRGSNSASGDGYGLGLAIVSSAMRNARRDSSD